MKAISQLAKIISESTQPPSPCMTKQACEALAGHIIESLLHNHIDIVEQLNNLKLDTEIRDL